ncbi:MAG: hypothetical protein ABS75_02710 [Pelagibacterium sp. SCN 63-23]|nr:MAG: hypothetical protein ABS75_02710 [Pelagibacterium sp. SCN 63-23]
MQATKTTPLFAATLRPDRSLKATGGWVGLVLAAIVAAPFLIAIPQFVLPGLAAFALAAAGLVVFSIRRNRRGGLMQQVTLWADQLEIVTGAPDQQRSLRRFDPAQLRLRLERDHYERTTGVFLRQGEEEIELGSFLSSDDKSSFAKAFGAALRLARKATA